MRFLTAKPLARATQSTKPHALGSRFKQLLRVGATHLARRSPPNIRATSATRSSRWTTLMSAVETPPSRLGNHDVVMGARRDLGQVRDHQDLVVFRQPSQAIAHLERDRAADPGVDLVEDQRRHLVEPARMVLSASIARDSSPPDAVRASGRASWPTFSATRNSTRSAPDAEIPSVG